MSPAAKPTSGPSRNRSRPKSRQPPPAAPAASGTDDKLAQLKELGELKTSGVLTDAEFEAQKAKILAG